MGHLLMSTLPGQGLATDIDPSSSERSPEDTFILSNPGFRV